MTSISVTNRQDAFMRLMSLWPAARTDALPVLLYHGVGPIPRDVKVGPTVTPDRFADQVRWLRERGYTTIGPDDCAAFVRDERPLPERPVMLTFDDGYQNLSEHALPTLLDNGMTATVFIVTSQV